MNKLATALVGVLNRISTGVEVPQRVEQIHACSVHSAVENENLPRSADSKGMENESRFRRASDRVFDPGS